jgi:hypothetical protein
MRTIQDSSHLVQSVAPTQYFKSTASNFRPCPLSRDCLHALLQTSGRGLSEGEVQE